MDDTLHTIQVEGTVYHVTEAGKAYLAKKPNPFRGTPSMLVRMPGAPKVVADRDAAAYIARLTRRIKATERHNHVIGRRLGLWRIETTDGHRALFLPTTDETLEELSLEIATPADNWFTVSEPFVLAVRRVAILAGQSIPVVRMRVESIDTQVVCVTVHARADDRSEWATETLEAVGSWVETPHVLILNVSYLLDGMGLYPAQLHYGDADRSVLIRPWSDVCRYAIMPVVQGDMSIESVQDNEAAQPELPAELPEPASQPVTVVEPAAGPKPVPNRRKTDDEKLGTSLAFHLRKHRVSPWGHRVVDWMVAQSAALAARDSRYEELAEEIAAITPAPRKRRKIA